MIEIELPDHDDLLDALCCHVCGCEMISLTTSNVYQYKGHDVRVFNIRAHRCLECGEEVYSSGVVELIEHALQTVVKED